MLTLLGLLLLFKSTGSLGGYKLLLRTVGLWPTCSLLWRIVKGYSSRKAGGPDQWKISELKALPPVAFDDLASFLGVVEATGRWPVGLTGAIVVKVPKDGATDATGLRPIGLLPTVCGLLRGVLSFSRG